MIKPPKWPLALKGRAEGGCEHDDVVLCLLHRARARCIGPAGATSKGHPTEAINKSKHAGLVTLL